MKVLIDKALEEHGFSYLIGKPSVEILAELEAVQHRSSMARQLLERIKRAMEE